MQHPDEGTIHAWLDGALSAEEAAAIESHVAECEECSAMVAEARGLIAASSRIVSALDIVPGGVIPAARPRRRAWYMSTQLRAAAAVIVVAGASLLVMRGGRKEAVMDQTRPTAAAVSAPAPVAEMKKPEADISRTQTKSAPVVKAKRIASANAPIKENAAARQASPKSNADEAMPMTPPPVATGAAVYVEPPNAARADASRPALQGKVSGAQLSDVVVTGVAEKSVSELRKVSSDSTIARIRTVYEPSPGVQVTLTETSVPSFMPQTLAQTAKTRERAAFDSVAARSAPQAANATVFTGTAAATNSIIWVDKAGHVMTLTGPMSKEQLQALRLRLPADKR